MTQLTVKITGKLTILLKLPTSSFMLTKQLLNMFKEEGQNPESKDTQLQNCTKLCSCRTQQRSIQSLEPRSQHVS